MQPVNSKVNRHLGGLSILITRPAEQAALFAETIEQAHGRPIRFPAMEILGPADKPFVKSALANLRNTDLLIFVSANAVRYAFPLMPDDIPLDLPIAAIGQATARALDEIGLTPTLMPDKNPDSEGLLNLPALQQVHHQRITIVRGNGGRETLKATLQARGATVEYIEVYRRRRPQPNPANLIANWPKMVDVVTVTSGEILQNLQAILGPSGTELLKNTPMLVASQRIAKQAEQLGCQHIHIAQSALDQDMLETLCEIAATDSIA